MKNRKQIPAETRKPPMPWRAPVELARHTPRQVRLSPAGGALAALITILVVAAPITGAWLWTASANSARLRERIEQEGIRAEAIIREFREERRGERRDERREFIGYEYRAGGSLYAGRATMRRFGPGQVGDEIAVRYLPEDPGTSWIAGFEPRVFPAFLAVLVPASLVMMAGLFFWLVRREQTLLAEGRAVEARVVASKKVKRGDHSKYQMECEFRMLSGATRKVKVEAGRPREAGTVVTMLYDSENPRRCAFYPLSLVRVAR